jgi:hypothetical protein
VQPLLALGLLVAAGDTLSIVLGAMLRSLGVLRGPLSGAGPGQPGAAAAGCGLLAFGAGWQLKGCWRRRAASRWSAPACWR